ncbi:MAG TPA: elongation factor G [Longimicrobium sp.]|jgi:elongation factor G|uniref:elongation factor G n=1 Tax=Longimicrobium sp. TaxID=2029185 RepID=UPI002EDB6B59
MASAPSFTTDRIRNVAVVGHGGSGKTTLVDACCYAAGTTRRHGSVDDGSALTMFTPEETAHGISMNVSVAWAAWMDSKINFIDTPGYLDFLGETRAGVRVADAALVCLSAVNGVEVGTERVWELIEERHLPAILFVSMMDRPNADFERVFQDVREHLTARAIPVEVPIGAAEGFSGIVNLFSDRAHFYKEGTASGEYEEHDVPPELQATVDRYYNDLIETIASTDDTLLEHYLEGDTITRDEALHALKQAMLRGELYPVFCGAPTRTWGTRALLSKIVELLPSPQERPAEVAAGRNGTTVELRGLNSDPFAALVFKTTSEPHVGELSYFRVMGGSVASGAEVLNASRDRSEKLAHLSIPQGRERLEVDALRAGDIGVVAKLRDTHTNDTLSAPGHPLVLDGIVFPEPDIAVAVEPATRGEEDKLAVGLHKLHEEDPCFTSEYVPELGQTIARGLGELHLEVQLERLKRKNGVEVVIKAPRIPYRETIRAVAEAQGRHKKQTGGRGQFGDAHLRLKPLTRGEGYRFTDSIVGGVIPGKYVPAVDKGVQEASVRGVLAGFPMVDFEAEVYFGSYHTVDSSEQAFKVAGSMAFQAAAEKAQPVILEPVMQVDVFAPDEYLGDIIGDLNQRRGQILGIEPAGRNQRVRALVPQAELYKYSTALRSLSQGRATHTRTFHAYEEVPSHEVPRVVESAKKERELLVSAR